MDEEATEAIEFEHHEMNAFAGVEPRFNLQHGHGSFLSNFSVSSCVISHTPFARIVVYLFVIVTCVPLIVGAAFTDIFIVDGNYYAAVPSFFTACLAAGTVSLFILHLLRKMEKCHDSGTLEGLKILSMFMSVASGISLGVCTILTFFNKQSFNLRGTNYYSSAVFSGLCLTTSIELYIVAQWYQNALRATAEAERVAKFSNSRTLGPTSAVIN